MSASTFPGDDRKIGLVVRFGLLCSKDGDRPAEVVHQVDVDVLAPLADGRLAVDPANVPDAVGDRPPVKLVRLSDRRPFRSARGW